MPRLSLAALALLLCATAATADDAFFTQRISPLLSRACLGCHDGAKKRGGLDLSSRKTALAGGESGAVIAPGDGAKSKLIQMVGSDKPRMPRSGPKLTAGEVAVLRKWIDDGAKWPDGVTLKAVSSVDESDVWWSLRTLKRQAIPAVRDRAWARNPVDAFVLAALEKRGLKPSAEADRRTLIRRVTCNLTGLPPTPEEVEAFVNDPSPDAYEKLVDRLLSSPAYGERWARHWLDVAHYGDSHGYDKDKRRDHAWPYRDWVIGAFNSDMPYRDFVRQQIAGDVLDPKSAEGATAAGFVVAGPWDFVGHVELREGTVDKEKTRLIDRDDMVQTVVGSFMSLTVGCARCHDHKFDPIDQRDYYRLQAVFAGVDRGDRRLDDGAATKRRAALISERDKVAAKRRDVEKQIGERTSPELKKLDESLMKLRADLAALPKADAKPSPSNGYHSGIVAKPDAVKWVQVDLGESKALDEVRLIPARPTDFRDAPGFGFPRRFRVEASDDENFAKPIAVEDSTKADVANPGDVPYRIAVKGVKARYVRVTATRLWERDRDYVFALAEMQVDSAGKDVARGRPVSALDSIEAGRWAKKFLVDGYDSRLQLPDTSDPKSVKAFRQRVELSDQIRKAAAERQRLSEKDIPATLKAERAKLEKQFADAEAAIQRSLAEGPRVYSVLPIAPRPIHVLKRGDVEQPKDQVSPAALSCVTGLDGKLAIDQPDQEGRRRLALADWIADERNALTWRSAVNRAWHYHFGRGIVDTPNDFGKMGSLPTHPALLDWLAADFRSHGSLKKLHRLIVTSAVYRQSSANDDLAAKVDSDNRYLWRMNRRRLDAESLRDAVLAVSGKLDRTMGGKGYDLFRFKDDHSPVYDHTDLARIHDPATYRRTVYRFTVRSVPNPFLERLDTADPNLPTPVRNTTLTALQALALMNNPFMVRQAKHFAERLEAGSSDPMARIDLAYRLAFGRAATDDERAAVAAHAAKHGLAAACRVLLNANEFVFVD